MLVDFLVRGLQGPLGLRGAVWPVSSLAAGVRLHLLSGCSAFFVNLQPVPPCHSLHAQNRLSVLGFDRSESTPRAQLGHTCSWWSQASLVQRVSAAWVAPF